MLMLVHDATADAVGEADPSTVDLDELCRLAATEMLAVALLAERRAYLDAHATELDATGHRLVVANGYARPRVVVTGAGPVEVTAPRVDDRRQDCRFSSAILPAYMRKSPRHAHRPTTRGAQRFCQRGRRPPEQARSRHVPRGVIRPPLRGLGCTVLNLRPNTLARSASERARVWNRQTKSAVASSSMLTTASASQKRSPGL